MLPETGHSQAAGAIDSVTPSGVAQHDPSVDYKLDAAEADGDVTQQTVTGTNMTGGLLRLAWAVAFCTITPTTHKMAIAKIR
jgi:hypothetical protein